MPTLDSDKLTIQKFTAHMIFTFRRQVLFPAVLCEQRFRNKNFKPRNASAKECLESAAGIVSVAEPYSPVIVDLHNHTMEENMALWSDPRFSDTEKRMQEQRVDDAFERSGIGPGFMMILGAAFGLVILGAVIGLGHPSTPTTVADQSLDRQAPAQIARPLPSVPNGR
ncbi:hypothetical protein [Hyphomicrobium sp.]|uniref:hypothetical protein n=1 Tax=Hyphomicrobium sp. TaxID=82 RepID=UPI0035656C71